MRKPERVACCGLLLAVCLSLLSGRSHGNQATSTQVSDADGFADAVTAPVDHVLVTKNLDFTTDVAVPPPYSVRSRSIRGHCDPRAADAIIHTAKDSWSTNCVLFVNTTFLVMDSGATVVVSGLTIRLHSKRWQATSEVQAAPPSLPHDGAPPALIEVHNADVYLQALDLVGDGAWGRGVQVGQTGQTNTPSRLLAVVVQFRNFYADWGAGIEASGGALVGLVECDFLNNTALQHGPAVALVDPPRQSASAPRMWVSRLYLRTDNTVEGVDSTERRWSLGSARCQIMMMRQKFSLYLVWDQSECDAANCASKLDLAAVRDAGFVVYDADAFNEITEEQAQALNIMKVEIYELGAPDDAATHQWLWTGILPAAAGVVLACTLIAAGVILRTRLLRARSQKHFGAARKQTGGADASTEDAAPRKANEPAAHGKRAADNEGLLIKRCKDVDLDQSVCPDATESVFFGSTVSDTHTHRQDGRRAASDNGGGLPDAEVVSAAGSVLASVHSRQSSTSTSTSRTGTEGRPLVGQGGRSSCKPVSDPGSSHNHTLGSGTGKSCARPLSVESDTTKPALRTTVTEALDDLCRLRVLFLNRFEIGPRKHQKHGSQGIVRFARDRTSCEDVAIKFFTDKPAFHQEHALYNRPELTSMMPAILGIVPNDDGRLRSPTGWPFPPCILVEKGECLASWAKRVTPDFPTTVTCLSQLAERLCVMHTTGLVHRDLKPANVLWRPKTFSWTLIDFGCAAAIGEKVRLAFSLYYAAPETIEALERGDRLVSAEAAVDIWSLGVMAYELLARCRCFPPFSSAESIKAQLLGRRPLPWETDTFEQRRVPELRALMPAVLSCLDRDPTKRPSAGQLKQAFESLFDPVVVPPSN